MVLVPIVSLSFYNAEQYPNLSSKFGMVWRFAPMADPLVSEWHCRDLGKVHMGQKCVEINQKLKLLVIG